MIRVRRFGNKFRFQLRALKANLKAGAAQIRIIDAFRFIISPGEPYRFLAYQEPLPALEIPAPLCFRGAAAEAKLTIITVKNITAARFMTTLLQELCYILMPRRLNCKPLRHIFVYIFSQW